MALSLNALQIISKLNSCHQKSLPKDTLAEVLGVHERTIRREVKRISALHAQQPLHLPFEIPNVLLEQVEGATRVRLVESKTPLSAAELFQYAAIYTALSHLKVLDDMVLGASGERVLDSLSLAKEVDQVFNLKQAFFYRPLAPKAYLEAALDNLEDIVSALVYRHPIRFEYCGQKDASPRLRELEPFTLVLHRDGFYLYGRKLSPGEDNPFRLFALERMQHVVILRNQSFKRPRSYKPEEHFSASFGIWAKKDDEVAIDLAFSPGAARVASARRISGFRAWKSLEDGRKLLKLKLSPTPDFVAWLLSWGAQVEVLQPQFLRQRIAREIAKMLQNYE